MTRPKVSIQRSRKDSLLSRLRGLAEAATPGPWTVGHVPFTHHVNNAELKLGVADCKTALETTPRAEQDAEYIAALDPSTVLKLLAVVEAADRCIDLLSFNFGGSPGPNGATNPQLGARDWLRKKLEALDD